LPLLDIEAERARVQASLGSALVDGRVELDELDRASLPALAATLEASRPDVLHLTCHGYPGAFVLEGETGQPVRCPARKLWDEALHVHPPRLLVLAACSTATPNREPWAPSPGLAQELLERGVPSVIAMEAPVGDAYARLMLAAFYDLLAGEAEGRISAAFAGARQQLEAQRRAGLRAGSEDLAQWATPVLFLAGPERALPVSSARRRGRAPSGVVEPVGGVRRAEGRLVVRQLTAEGRTGAVVVGAPGLLPGVLVRTVAQELEAAGWRVARPSTIEACVRLSDEAAPAAGGLIVVEQVTVDERGRPTVDELAELLQLRLLDPRGWKLLLGARRSLVLDEDAHLRLSTLRLGPLERDRARLLARRLPGLSTLEEGAQTRLLDDLDGDPELLLEVANRLRMGVPPDAAVRDVRGVAWAGVREAAAGLLTRCRTSRTLLAGVSVHRTPVSAATLSRDAHRVARRQLRQAGERGSGAAELIDGILDDLAEAGLVRPAVSTVGAPDAWVMPGWIRSGLQQQLPLQDREGHHRSAFRHWKRQLEAGERNHRPEACLEEMVHHAFAARDDGAALEALTYLAERYHGLGRTAEVRRLCGLGLERTPDRTLRRAHLLFTRGKAEQRRGAWDQARAFFRECLSIEDELGTVAWAAATCQHLAQVADAVGSVEEADRLFERALDASTRAGDRPTQDGVWEALAASGRLDEGAVEQRLEAVLVARLARGDERGAGFTLLNLGGLAERRGELRLALDRFAEAKARFTAAGDMRGRAAALAAEGRLESGRGAAERALDLLREALELQEQAEDLPGAAATCYSLGDCLASSENLAEAEAWFLRAVLICRDAGLERDRARALRAAARAAAGEGRSREAAGRASEALETSLAVGDERGAALARTIQAELALEQGDFDGAGCLLQAAIPALDRAGARVATARARELLASTALELGEASAALTIVEEARSALDPGDDIVLYGRCLVTAGRAAGAIGELELGLDFLREALGLELPPELAADANRVAGLLLVEADRPREAIRPLVLGTARRLERGGGLRRDEAAALVGLLRSLGRAPLEELVHDLLDPAVADRFWSLLKAAGRLR